MKIPGVTDELICKARTSEGQEISLGSHEYLLSSQSVPLELLSTEQNCLICTYSLSLKMSQKNWIIRAERCEEENSHLQTQNKAQNQLPQGERTDPVIELFDTTSDVKCSCHKPIDKCFHERRKAYLRFLERLDTAL